MKLNISDPTTGASKVVDFEDEKKYHIFFDKRISQEVDASPLGDEYKGYIFRITGGSDKQGFGMKQGVLTNHRVRLLLDGRTSGFHITRKDGQRKRKTVRGCIVAQDISVLDVTIVKKGESEIDGVTNKNYPNRLGPKRASKIRKLFNLSKEDNVCQYVIRRTIPSKKEGGKAKTKAPKIQRLVTPLTLQRKRHLRNLMKRRWAKAAEERKAYHEMLGKIATEKKNARKEELALEKAKHERKLARRAEAKKKAEAEKKKAEEAAAKKATKKQPAKKAVAEKKPAEKPAAKKPAAEKKPAQKPAPKKTGKK